MPLQGDQLSRMTIRGFKSIKNCDISFGKINVLIGSNGAGKSNFISAFSFLQNILSIVLARVPLAWYTARFCLDSLFPMGLAAPAGSLLSVVVCLIAYKLLRKNSPELREK